MSDPVRNIRLDSVARILAGGKPGLTGNHFVDSGYPAFGAGGLNGFLPEFEFEDGAIILSSIGARCGKCFYPVGKWASLANTQLIFPNPELVDRKFLWYQLNDESLWHRSGTAQPYIKPSDVKGQLVSLPPLPEQRRIADILDRANNLRNQRRRALALCTELADATFVDIFSKNSVAKVTTFPLEEVVAVGTTVTYGIVQAGDEVPGGVPYIRTGDLVDGHINQERLRRTSPEIALRFPRSRVKSGEIVISIRATVGTTAVVPPSLDGANLTQGTARISPGESVLTEYLLAYLRSAAAQNWLQAQVKGATFREITLGRLRQMPIPVPELGLQQNFRQRIQSLEHIRAQQETHLTKLNELFASLQHRAFQGEL